MYDEYFDEAEVIIESNGRRFIFEDNSYPDDVFESSPLYLESVRFMIGDHEGVLSDEEVAIIIAEAERVMTTAELKLFKNIAKKVGRGIKKFGKKAVKFGKKALPVVGRIAQIAAPVAGMVLGGPAGAKIGGLVSKGIGKLMKGKKVNLPKIKIPSRIKLPTGIKIPSKIKLPPIVPKNVQLAGATKLLSNHQPAVNQLLGLLQNPALLQSVVGQALGGTKAGTLQLSTPNMGANSKVPFGSMMNLLGQLATQAAIEASEDLQEEPTYLYDETGDFMIENPASSEDRADLLLEMLYEYTLFNYEYPTKMEQEQEQQFDNLTEWLLEAQLIN
ncbi:MAG: hypothetical protein AAGG68_28435 [Bacteroidota bacterium]